MCTCCFTLSLCVLVLNYHCTLLPVSIIHAAVVGSHIILVRCNTRGLLAGNYCLVSTLLYDKVGREVVPDHIA